MVNLRDCPVALPRTKGFVRINSQTLLCNQAAFLDSYHLQKIGQHLRIYTIITHECRIRFNFILEAQVK